MIQVAHVTSWLSSQGGGIPPVIRGLVRESAGSGVDCVVAGLADESVKSERPFGGVETFFGEAIGPKCFGYSPMLRRRLSFESNGRWVIHSHGLWMYPGVAARQGAGVMRAPLVISPHGMLEPWALENSQWKKRIAAVAFENGNLRAAACLHALCEAEAVNLRRYGLRNPIAVIPNGVDLEEEATVPPYASLELKYPQWRGKRRLLFLSRLHPKKGLPHLIRAWSDVAPQHRDWILLVAGNDQLGHEQAMRQLAAELGQADTVIFLGPLYGDSKRVVLAGADAFILPSFSEGFSMAILEAAAAGLPVVLTNECNFPELTLAGGAMEVRPEESSCAAGLRQLMALSDEQRKNMGARGQELVRQNYTWPAIATRMNSVYRWLLRETVKPGFVHLN